MSRMTTLVDNAPRSLGSDSLEQNETESKYCGLWTPLGGLPASLADKARTELHEDHDTIISALRNLRSLIVKHEKDGKGKHVYRVFHECSDEVMLKFLRARKFNTKKTYELMKGYVSYRIKYPELFEDLNLDRIKKCLMNCYPGLLPVRDSEGHAVLLYTIRNWTEHEYPFDVVMQGYIYLLELLMQNEENQVNGLVLIKDFGDYSLRHAFSMRLSNLKKMIDMLQGSFPARFQGIHVIRQPWYFTWVYNLVKPFLKAKLLKRVHIHGYDFSKFHHFFERDTLPEDFGGDLPAYDPTKLICALEMEERLDHNSPGGAME